MEHKKPGRPKTDRKKLIKATATETELEASKIAWRAANALLEASGQKPTPWGAWVRRKTSEGPISGDGK